MKSTTILSVVASLLLLSGFIPHKKLVKEVEYETFCLADSSLGKPVFIRALPINEYVEVDNVKDKIFKKAGESEFGMEKVINMAQKAMVQGQGKDFDAIIIEKVNKAVLVKYKTKSNPSSLGKAQKIKGLDIFIYSKPVQPYSTGETIEINNFGIGQMDNTGDDLERMVNGLVQKANKKVKKEEIKAANGIYIGSESMKSKLGVPVSSSAVVLRYSN